MSNVLVPIAIGAGCLAAVIAIGCGIRGLSLASNAVFAPQEEAVRRSTFENSKAYNQGMIQELQNMQFEYIKAAPEHRAALSSIILRRAADYPEDRMPADLLAFVRSLKNRLETPSTPERSFK